MKEVLLIGRGTDGRFDRFFPELIEGEGKYRLTRFPNGRPITSQFLRKKRYAAVIFDCFHVEHLDAVQIEKISRLTAGLPIIVIAKQALIEPFQRLHQLKNTVVIQSVFSVERFRVLLHQMSCGLPFKSRICPRFVTNEAIQLSMTDAGLLLESRIRNYSAGGMFVECAPARVRVGDRVHLAIPSTTPEEGLVYRRVDARVVWKRSAEHSRLGLGIAFL